MGHYVRIIVCYLFFLLLLDGCAKQEEKTAKENAQPEKSSGIVSVEGAELHYLIEGNGIPCIVLGHSESQRQLLSQELRKHFKLVFMDLRHDAQSNSSLEVSKITLDTYLDDIDKVRRTLGLDRTAVLGHSHHGLIALEYARKYPNNTSHVVVTCCYPYRPSREVVDEFWESDASDERKTVLKQNWEKIEDEVSKMSPKERFVKNYMALAPKLLYDPTDDSAFVKRIEAVDNDRDVFFHYQREILKDYDVAERHGRIETPVFLGLGRYDYALPYYLWDDRRDILPNLSYNLFEKSGHFPMVEEQELFDEKLIEWIKDH